MDTFTLRGSLHVEQRKKISGSCVKSVTIRFYTCDFAKTQLAKANVHLQAITQLINRMCKQFTGDININNQLKMRCNTNNNIKNINKKTKVNPI